MKNLKNYKSYKISENKQTDGEIHELCRKYNIENYTINEDKSIDVDGDVDLYNKGLSKLPLKFRHVKGDFDCSDNNLITLEGAPKTVVGNFYCQTNELLSFKYFPLISGYILFLSNPIFEKWQKFPKRMIKSDYIRMMKRKEVLNEILE